jgi:hypothetical protein
VIAMPSLQVKVPAPNGLSFIAPYTVLRDEQGNLYVSDEFKHNVFSLDQGGSLRWQGGGKGRNPCEFLYPRGMALGRVLVGSKSECCVAVCDAWNNRIQFLDLDGKHLGSWESAGGREFNEVCDIRYLTDPRADGVGCWYVLDRGNHRLCALGNNGQLHFEIGQCVPPLLTSRLLATEFDFASGLTTSKVDHDFPNYEPLYYPTKILGQSETALYLFEPFSNQLKQPLFGSLLPLPIRPPDGSEWISAAEDEFLAWNRTSQHLTWMNNNGDIIYDSPVDGTPVNTDANTGEVWLHSGDRLELWRFDELSKPEGKDVASGLFAALANAATKEVVSNNPADMIRMMSTGLSTFFGFCDQFLDLMHTGCRDVSVLESVQARAISSWHETLEACRPSGEQVRESRLLFLKLPILVLHRDHNHELLELWYQFESSMIEAVHHRDEAIFLLHDMQRYEESIDSPLILKLAELVKFQLTAIKQMLFFRRAQIRRTELRFLPSNSTEENLNDESPMHWIAPRRDQFFSPASRCLHELARFGVLPSETRDLPRPHSVVQTQEGDYFVTLNTRGTLAHLDADGKHIEDIFGTKSGRGTLAGPTGLTLDSEGRLWIVEQMSKRVRIYDHPRGNSGENVVFPGTSDLLVAPEGIGEGPDGSMLVADRDSQRLIALHESGTAEIFCDRVGTGPGEFHCPTDICTSVLDADPGYWIVDQRNHRLQKLDRFSQFVRQIGLCGSGIGSFLTPWCVAQFADGVLVVSQGEIEPCLKLFSPEGTELDCIFLEYMPAGLFIRNERLIVTEWDGQSIRIYERTL